MTISDSLPIQFWLTSQSTFNESTICGIFKDCFCQHLNYGQEYYLQFNHDTDLTLRFFDQNGNQLASQSMDDEGNGYWGLSFVPNTIIGSDTIKKIQLKVFHAGTELAHSDCVTIGGTVDYGTHTKDFDLDCQTDISYTNAQNFDGILYEQSPVPVFSIALRANFWDDENPTERTDLELSNGEVVTLRAKLQQKVLLETEWMPPYMHLKLQKILMHDTVTINGEQYRQRDEYERGKSNKYGLSVGKVLLTKYDSVQRNTI